jgi:TetR/AcrR family transcriptional regulator, transcriptional repressor for nem operon
LIGNFSIEASDQSELIRQRLTEIVKDITESLIYCLKAGVDAGELSASTDVREIASFLYWSLPGAILQSKVELSVKPLERFRRVLFSQLLH